MACYGALLRWSLSLADVQLPHQLKAFLYVIQVSSIRVSFAKLIGEVIENYGAICREMPRQKSEHIF